MVTIPTRNQPALAKANKPSVEQYPVESSKNQEAAGIVDRWSDGYLEHEFATEDQNFKPLTRVEAQRICTASPPAPLMRIVGLQVLTSAVIAGLVWLLTMQEALGWSALYGGVAVWVPAALFARGLQRQKASRNAGSALISFFVWELVKIVLTVVLLLAAPRLVPELNWLALLAGFVVTMKVYWVAMWLHLARTNSVGKAVVKTVQENG
jgi:ATP synthase protein I